MSILWKTEPVFKLKPTLRINARDTDVVVEEMKKLKAVSIKQ